MSDRVYKVVEVVGSSADGIEPAIRNAVTRASRNLRNIGWFEVISTRGHIEDNVIKHFQVTLKLGFTLDE